MEALISVSSVLISLACIVVLTWVIKAVNWLWLRPKKMERMLRQQGIPGTPYRFMYGDMKGFTSMATRAMEKPMSSVSHDYFPRIEPFRQQFLTKLNADAGKNYFIWFGPFPMVNFSKPELIREILSKMEEFKKPKFNPIADRLFPGIGCYEGEKWAKHRKIVDPAFYMEKLKLMLPAFSNSCSDIIDKWENIVAEKGSSELDAWPYLKTLSADAISRAAFGSSYKEGQKVFQILKEQTDITLRMIQSIYIPGWRHVPTPINKRFKENEDQIRRSLTGIINKRKEAMDAGEVAKDDLLGILIDSNLNEIRQASHKKKNLHLGMNLQEVIDECKLFYIAGQETTSILLAWTLILLSKYQDWQARAREEVLQTFGNKTPDCDGLNHLRIMTMILNEVLRLYPPVVQLTRQIQKDERLGDVKLPAGALLSFSLFAVHRNKEIWGEDAEEFKPQRFSEGIAKATKGNPVFFPFGGGPRICIGEKFALMEAKMALSMILQRFSFELSPSYVHAPMLHMFVQPQHGVQIILHRF